MAHTQRYSPETNRRLPTATMMFVLLVAVAIFASTSFPEAYGQQDTACSPENRASNLNPCLAAIRFSALDMGSSRYGPAYFNRCPPEERFKINCFEVPRVEESRSLAQMTFCMDDPDLSTLDRFLRIQYTSPAGSYSGCDHTYNYPNEKSFYIDPLSNNAYPSWDLRQAPHVTWDYNQGEVFTLIMVDPNQITRSVVSNIRGNDFNDALYLYSYDGHKNWQNSARPASFILYRQTRQVFLHRPPSSGFNVTDFAERNQLQGPIALSWVNALYDAYTVGSNTWGENCASLVQDTLSVRLPGIIFLPGPDEVNLSVFLRVHFTTTPATYNCGDHNVTRPAEDFYLDSIDPDSNILDTADLRLDSSRNFTFTMNKVNPSPRDFDGKLHTLMLIAHGGMFHGMIINIEGDNVSIQGVEASTGNLLAAYQPPNPTEAEGAQRLMFVLFEQAARLPTTLDPAPYLSPTGNGEFTNLDGFLSDCHMSLVGVARMLVTFDEYSRCNQSTDGSASQATANCLN